MSIMSERSARRGNWHPLPETLPETLPGRPTRPALRVQEVAPVRFKPWRKPGAPSDHERCQGRLEVALRQARVRKALLDERERVRYFVVLLTASMGLVVGACIGAVSMAWWGASGAAFAVGLILLLGHVVLRIAARKAGGRKST